MNTNDAYELLEKAFAEWRKRETLKREKVSIRKFANYLGYSQALVGFWLNKDQNISENAIVNIAPKLAELLGEEIYEKLEIQKPNLLHQYASTHWENLPEEEQKRIAKIIAKYTDDPLPNEPKTQPATKAQ
jgi:transcriptional regulator with XRE-family HTH domain